MTWCPAGFFELLASFRILKGSHNGWKQAKLTVHEYIAGNSSGHLYLATANASPSLKGQKEQNTEQQWWEYNYVVSLLFLLLSLWSLLFSLIYCYSCFLLIIVITCITITYVWKSASRQQECWCTNVEEYRRFASRKDGWVRRNANQNPRRHVGEPYPLVNVCIANWKITIFNG